MEEHLSPGFYCMTCSARCNINNLGQVFHAFPSYHPTETIELIGEKYIKYQTHEPKLQKSGENVLFSFFYLPSVHRYV